MYLKLKKMHNRYFIIDSNDINIKEIEKIIVGRLSEQRLSLDKKLMAIKLNKDDHNEYKCLKNYKEIEDVSKTLNTDKWRILPPFLFFT